MICSPANFPIHRQRREGFTLVEVLISAVLGSMILAGVLATFMLLLRSSVRTTNYAAMETETRMAFERLGIDARMASGFSSTFTGNTITSFTLTIPDINLSSARTATYVYDTSDPTNKKLVLVPGNNPAATTGRTTLVNNVSNMTFLRYSISSGLIAANPITAGTDDLTVKHIQISVSVSRSTTGVAAATQIIRSSAFTLRDI